MRRSRASEVKPPEQVARADEQRAANRRARDEGQPLPHPNPWDVLDHTKLPPDSPPELFAERYKAFCEICPPPKRIEYTL